ncbi:hypothetical protein GQ54DRAFT_298514 [Martensiomyces pterosporus]|nr:hypothetical protein GQ54DRAFT_298514 [Martensiomyces pterosporus]
MLVRANSAASVSEEGELGRLELAEMHTELEWLLKDSIPESIKHIRQSLQKLSILSSKHGAGAARASESRLDLAAASSGAKGTATISGTVVTHLSLDVAISSQFNQGKTTTIYLKKNETLSLLQAQEAKSYVKSALYKAEATPLFDSCGEAMRYIEGLMRDISRAKRILAVGSQQDLLPLQPENSEKFAPALPENLVIECGLRGSVFIAHVYWLKFRRGVKSTGILDAFKKDPSAGHMLVHKGRLAEVKREIVFESPLEKVEDALSTLDRALVVCADMLGQLHAFDSM